VSRRISIAPMMDRTDRHFRFVLRAISQRVTLFTEMITAQAILRGDRQLLLAQGPTAGPVALQLGGDDPVMLAEAAAIGQEWGYSEINLNCGCPSDRVVSGSFGAVLMRTPERVASAVRAMQAAVSVPVSVKHRIGVDELDSFDHMQGFVRTIADVGCTRFSVHARKAWLTGLSPKENRTVPPLRYDEVYRLKAENPSLWIEINGGILDLERAADHLERVDGVMIGRAACDDPYLLVDVDRRFYADDHPLPTREDVVRAVVDYLGRHDLGRGFRPHHALRHLLDLYNGQPGARRWRRLLTEGMARGTDAGQLLGETLAAREARSAAGGLPVSYRPQGPPGDG
jgi:tRNA-dihydrouridine synthase A